jgi:hypothetical protein
MSSQAPDTEPLAYKFVGVYQTWLCVEWCCYVSTQIQPMYAPIEDEV